MTNHQYVTVTRTLLKRGVTDIERKLAAAATSGALGYVLLTILEAYGVKVPAQLADLIPYASAILGGYLSHSVGAQTHSVVTEPTGRITETTTTGAIALPVEGASFTEEGKPYTATRLVTEQHISVARPTPEPEPTPDEVPDVAPTQAFTQVIQPDQSRAGAFLSRLPSATGPVAQPEPAPVTEGWRN